MPRALVLSEVGAPMQLAEIDLPAPGPNQVRVRIAAAGVCHSDLSLANGTLRQPVPAVLGHEGAGTVVEIGAGVTGVVPGDRVVLNWSPACGTCQFCRRGEGYLCIHGADAGTEPYARLSDGTPLYPGLGTAAFAEETVVPAGGVVPLPDGVPFADAALLGCAVLTGYGAVTHAARVRSGESVVVYGLGGVGLAVVQSARLAGADPIIGVDVNPGKEPLARRAGATHFLVADPPDAKPVVPRQVRELTGDGTDHAIECVGRAATIRAAWSSTRRGGATTVVGVGRADDMVAFSALELFHFARTLRGCVYGNGDPTTDLPVLAGHVREGRLDVAALVTDRIGLGDIPAAFERMSAGIGARSVVEFDSAGN
ncbi:MAG TPA: alcohol dehydrogenase catalytic domain-containing protein [Micromonosporaceae bacterium]|nr:alcohol dehydrogenase catalytic domain-containing protein [Micromonosporaceae bacterium]